MVMAYAIGLEGMTAEQLRLATDYLLKHHEVYMPTPAQIRNAPTDRTQQADYVAPDPFYCPDCKGSGWLVVPHPESRKEKIYERATMAVRCKHENR